MPITAAAILGVGVIPAESAAVRIDDAALLRGDGAFETMHLRPDGPWLLDHHLERLRRSAEALFLPLPPRAALDELVAQVCAARPGTGEAVLRLVVTRGAEDGTRRGSVFAFVTEVPALVAGQRRDGVAVVTASLQVPAEARPAAPWLLPGVKSLSYATNMAALRWARGHGADELLWTSSDGYALEAPTATLLWLRGRRLCTVPAERTGILAGITARHLLDHASRADLRPAEEMVTPAALQRADAVWLASSVRGLAEVRRLDGVPLPSSTITAALRELAGFIGGAIGGVQGHAGRTEMARSAGERFSLRGK